MNTTPHLTADMIDRWQARRLAPAEILAASDHVARCAECASALANRPPDEVAAAVDRLLEPDRGELTHVAVEQLERWVDGTADPVESELVTSHLAACEICRAEAGDLQRFAASLSQPATSRRWMPWLAAAAAAVLAVGLALDFGAGRTSPSAPPSAATQPPKPSVQPLPSITLRDGGLTITVHGDGGVEGVPEAWSDEVAAVLRRPALTVPAIVLAVARIGEVQRSATDPRDEEVRLVGPLSRILDDARPTFHWAGPPGTEYRVEVYDPRFTLVAASEFQPATSWKPPIVLPRGELITWKVTAFRQGVESTYPAPPRPPAVFQVVTAEAARELEAARPEGSHLVTGLILWRVGLVEEAASDFAALATQNPDSPVAKQLAAQSARGAEEALGRRTER